MKMKKHTKKVLLMIMMSVIMSIFIFPSSAETNITEVRIGSYEKRWYLTRRYFDKTTDIDIGSMTWGYNTFAFNEDICRVTPRNNNMGKAQIKRINYDTAFQSASAVSDGYTSSLDVRHKNGDNTTVHYRMNLNGTYSGYYS